MKQIKTIVLMNELMILQMSDEMWKKLKFEIRSAMAVGLNLDIGYMNVIQMAVGALDPNLRGLKLLCIVTNEHEVAKAPDVTKAIADTLMALTCRDPLFEKFFKRYNTAQVSTIPLTAEWDKFIRAFHTSRQIETIPDGKWTEYTLSGI